MGGGQAIMIDPVSGTLMELRTRARMDGARILSVA